MDLFEAFRIRRSIRAYARQPVEEDKLNRILEAARSAPSAGAAGGGGRRVFGCASAGFSWGMGGL